MRNLKVWTGVVVGVGVLLGGASLAYDLPRVIGEFRPQRQGAAYAEQFGCIGDQDNDGKDELILSARDDRCYEIYLGDEHMGGQANFVLNLLRGQNEAVREVAHIGRLLPDIPNVYIIQNVNYSDTTAIFDFYSGVGRQEEHLWMTWASHFYRDGGRRILDGRLTRPLDFNGDGYDEFVCFKELTESIGAIEIYFGGGEFDTLPGWRKCFGYTRRQELGSFEFVSGYDLNSDAYDDVLLRVRDDRDTLRDHLHYEVFLGGAQADTNAVIQFSGEDFMGKDIPIEMTEGFAMLQDVNDDGYDDFGVYYRDDFNGGGYTDGIYVFFGGEQIDAEPDLILNGGQLGASFGGYLASGDFNGDGVGDIVAGFGGGPPDNSEIHYHFGSNHIGESPDFIITGANYGNRYGLLQGDVGAVGDYDGDGYDDLALHCTSDIRLVILAGSRDWRVDVPGEDQPKTYRAGAFTLHPVYPTPFNGSSTISFDVTVLSELSFDVYSLTGSLCGRIEAGTYPEGSRHITWNGVLTSSGYLPTGYYFLRAASGSFVQTQSFIIMR